jgi:hypothetical protein
MYGGQKTTRCLMFLVSRLSWLPFVFWLQRDKLLYQAITSAIPSFRLKKCEKYKGFSKSLKGKYFQHIFQFFLLWNNFYAKSDWEVWLLRSRRSFRHQDRPNWLMSYFNVICYNMTFNFIWRIWHKSMTFVTLVDLGV